METIGYSEITHLTTLGKDTIQRLVASGDFPQPIKTGHRITSQWRRDDVIQWLETRPTVDLSYMLRP